MQVEAIAWIRPASLRTTKKEREFSIRNSLFGEIVIHHQDISSLVHEVFAYRNTGIWRQELKRRGSGCRSIHNNGVSERACIFQLLDDARGLRFLLTDSNIDTDWARFFRLKTLVDYGVYRYCRFSCCTVSDKKFALTTTNRDH